MRLDESVRNIEADADLEARMRGDVSTFYRRINVQASEAVCRSFARPGALIPQVRLHGDAHVEQFTVTAHSAGLGDFDDSSTGPGVIDLVRFGASLHLACEGRHCDSRSLVDTFLDGYRDGLRDPQREAPEPSLVARLRARFPTERSQFLLRSSSIMIQLSPIEEAEVRAGFARWARIIQSREPAWGPGFFVIKAVGYHEIGVGSHGEPKIVARIEGPTADDDDDIIVEAKALRDLSGVSCVDAPRGDALRILAGHLHIGKRRDPFLAVVPRDPAGPADSAPYWVQSWSPAYAELSLRDGALTEKELREVAYDVGMQLGQGHVCHSHSTALRTAELTWLQRHKSEVRSAARELAASVVSAWSSWRQATAQPTNDTTVPETGDQ